MYDVTITVQPQAGLDRYSEFVNRVHQLKRASDVLTVITGLDEAVKLEPGKRNDALREGLVRDFNWHLDGEPDEPEASYIDEDGMYDYLAQRAGITKLKVIDIAHVLYRTGDADVPSNLLDSNGEVALSQCRVCGQAESELQVNCPGAPQQ